MKKHLICAIVLLTSLVVASAQDSDRKNLRRFNKAYTYATEGNNRKAIDLLQTVYKSNPDDINVAYNLGVCYLNMSGNPDSAMFYFNRVVELDNGEWSEARSTLMLAIARVKQLKYDFDGALEVYKEIESHDAEREFAEDIAREREICANAKLLVANPVKFNVKRLDDNVNCQFNDYRPVLSNDQNTLIFTSRRRNGTGVYFDDGEGEEMSYICYKENGKWSAAERLDDLFSSKGQATVTCISGNELYLVRDGNIYVSKKDSASGKWLRAENVGAPINSRDNEKYAYVTPDGSEMFFSSDREGGFGGYDIYHSYRLPNGLWGKPCNVGSSINTQYDEDSPVMHPTKRVLYFSSNGHNTMGGYDVFYSIQNTADSTFEVVQNFGYPINTPDDDLFFVPTSVKDMAYYASIQWNKGADKFTGYDIYEAEYDEPEVNKLVILSGVVFSENIADIKVTAECDGETIGRYVPNQETGKFVVIVEEGKSYTVIASNGKTERTAEVATNVGDSYYKLGHTVKLADFSFVEEEKKEAALAANIVEEQQPINSTVAKVTEDANGGYTVQVFSLRKPVNMKCVKSLDPDQINEYQYKDGWYVYSYGHYETYSGAKKVRDMIIETSPYIDAFVRKISSYDKFLK
ncbi:MAG: tetratricopeptide repeat protein [Bacteroidales bacterium]|nr:tetratricopeptide repeat protein [Bacteroidales bacterium]